MDEDGSMDYISGLTNSAGSGGVSSTPLPTSIPVSSVSVTVSGGGGGSTGTIAMGGGDSYYSYEYDSSSRGYRCLPSSIVGRNYLYPPTSVALNQVRTSLLYRLMPMITSVTVKLGKLNY